MNGKHVTMLFPQNGIASKIFPADVVEFLNDYYRQKGVEVLAGQEVRAVEGSGTDLTVVTASGRRIAANAIVAGVGVAPNVELAEAAGLEVGDGVVVNEMLQTSHADIYAAGDMANFYDAVLGTRRRVEHEDAANSMGKAAGRAMAGKGEKYTYSPMFYSDLFELGYEAVGELDSSLETVADWKKKYDTGVIYYLKDRRVRGALLWNVWGKVDAARDLIAQGKEFSPKELHGMIK
jgi:3-phenylpropionate/trans-cinnamate dioxygenase ferredoxin reductase subunit